jgi:C1A family cysteine protease
VSLQTAQNEFIRFQRTYQRSYSNEEFQHRFKIFQSNMEKAAAHQAANPKARFGVTKFMDLTPEEFSSMYLMSNVTEKLSYQQDLPVVTDFSDKWTSDEHPSGVDAANWNWFNQGVCTPVYDQGQCGSCWAFSATETIESYYKLSGHALTKLSMEQIVDCDTTCYGCGGGWPYLAYNYVKQAGGIDTYASYPYTAGNGVSGSCQQNRANYVAQVSGYASVQGESGLYSQLSKGPVSVCVDASTWQYYNGGVLTTCSNSVDHCVQLTGYANYGTSSAYWIVRNSWNTNWGEAGFIWIEIGKDLCLIGDYATVVTAN